MLSFVVHLPWKKTPSSDKFLPPCPSNKKTTRIECRRLQTVLQNAETLISFLIIIFWLKCTSYCLCCTDVSVFVNPVFLLLLFNFKNLYWCVVPQNCTPSKEKKNSRCWDSPDKIIFSYSYFSCGNLCIFKITCLHFYLQRMIKCMHNHYKKYFI